MIYRIVFLAAAMMAAAALAQEPKADKVEPPQRSGVHPVLDFPTPAIVGLKEFGPHQLVRLGLVNLPPQTVHVEWIVFPDESVEMADVDGHDKLQFTAKPGTYQIVAVIIYLVDVDAEKGTKRLERFVVRSAVTIRTCGGPSPEQPPQPQPQPPVPPGKFTQDDLVKARVGLQFGNAFCTGQFIDVPPDRQGRTYLLTAAHCVPGVGAKGKARLHDQRVVDVTVVVRNTKSDVSVLVTDQPLTAPPRGVPLATIEPPVGTAIFHVGLGIDRPGNRENGAVVGYSQRDDQIVFELNVSPGDSGSAIVRADTLELVSVVCCTESLARKGRVWGASVTAITAAVREATNPQKANSE